MELVLIATGGALGAVSRYWMSGWVAAATDGSFPWGTLTVNVVGSFFLGFVLVLLDTMLDSTPVRALVAVGFLGAFTTFSTFSYEALALIQDGEWSRALGYSGGSLVLGVVGVLVGFAAATMLIHGRA
jgi:CrcB protein